MEISERLKSFFKERPAVKMTGFAKECGCTRAMLYFVMNKETGISTKLTAKVLFNMEKYGYKL